MAGAPRSEEYSSTCPGKACSKGSFQTQRTSRLRSGMEGTLCASWQAAMHLVQSCCVRHLATSTTMRPARGAVIAAPMAFRATGCRRSSARPARCEGMLVWKWSSLALLSTALASMVAVPAGRRHRGVVVAAIAELACWRRDTVPGRWASGSCCKCLPSAAVKSRRPARTTVSRQSISRFMCEVRMYSTGATHCFAFTGSLTSGPLPVTPAREIVPDRKGDQGQEQQPGQSRSDRDHACATSFAVDAARRAGPSCAPSRPS